MYAEANSNWSELPEFKEAKAKEPTFDFTTSSGDNYQQKMMSWLNDLAKKEKEAENPSIEESWKNFLETLEEEEVKLGGWKIKGQTVQLYHGYPAQITDAVQAD